MKIVLHEELVKRSERTASLGQENILVIFNNKLSKKGRGGVPTCSWFQFLKSSFADSSGVNLPTVVNFRLLTYFICQQKFREIWQLAHKPGWGSSGTSLNTPNRKKMNNGKKGRDILETNKGGWCECPVSRKREERGRQNKISNSWLRILRKFSPNLKLSQHLEMSLPLSTLNQSYCLGYWLNWEVQGKKICQADFKHWQWDQLWVCVYWGWGAWICFSPQRMFYLGLISSHNKM